MSIFFMTLLQFFVALAFFVIWAEDRSRRYFLWWGAAHLALPCIFLTTRFILTHDLGNYYPLVLLYSGFVILMVLGFAGGARSYSGKALTSRGLVAAAGLVFGLIMAVYLMAGWPHVRELVSILTSATFAYVSVLLWPRGGLERLAAALFLIRAIASLLIGFTLVPSGTLPADILSFSLALTFATALVLLLASFRRANTELEAHYQTQTLTNGIITALQNVADEFEIVERVIPLFTQDGFWDSGGLLIPNEQRTNFRLIYLKEDSADTDFSDPRYYRWPIDGTLAGFAFRSGQLVESADYRNDPRVNREIRAQTDSLQMGLSVCIPLLGEGVCHGVLVLRTHREIHLSPEHKRNAESVGQVLGTSLLSASRLRKLSYQATHDSLTGLGNRSALHTYMNAEFVHGHCCLMLFDLNHFKEVNDTLGHHMGDQLLAALAARLAAELASDSVKVFRLGGDEFVVIYVGVEHTNLQTMRAGELAALISRPFTINEVCLRTSAAIGIVDYTGTQPDSHELLRCADVAMYQAKHDESGIACYSVQTDADIQRRVQLLSDAAEALENHEFELFYQPQLSMHDNSCRRCESLIRWRHPQHGLLTAGIFMPVIEATDLIRPITYRVIDIAMQTLADWQQKDLSVKVSVNLSSRNLLDPELTSYLLQKTREYNISPSQLELEVTETVLMKDPQAASLVLKELSDSGFSIALDDFGTGYSSLAYLARFPIDILKIDQSFVRSMLVQRQSRSIVKSTIALTHELDLEVTAEGIETQEAADMLKDFDCDFAQGYLYARPMPKAEFEHWWQAHSQTQKV